MKLGKIKSSLHFFVHLSAGQYQPSAEGFPVGKVHNMRAVCQRVYIGSASGAPIGVKRKFGDVGFRYGRGIILFWRMHNRQAEIAVLTVCDFVTYEAGLAAVSAGTDKPAAECVPIVQKYGGLSVYQALGGTDAAVLPK